MPNNQWRIVCVPDDKNKKPLVMPMTFDDKSDADTWLDELGFRRGDDFEYIATGDVPALLAQLEADNA